MGLGSRIAAAALPAKERALADAIGEQFRQALAEDRLIRTGQMPETFTPGDIS